VCNLPSQNVNDAGNTLGESRRGVATRQNSNRQMKLRETTMITTNIRSLRQGSGDLAALATIHKPHFICVTETHLDGDPIDCLTPPSYQLAARADRNRFGGGVLIFTKEDMLPDEIVISDLAVKGKLEFAAVKAGGVSVVCIYRSPTCDNGVLIEKLEQLRNRLPDRCVLTGDFNVHHTEWLGSSSTDSDGESLYEFCQGYGLNQLANKPNRGCNILDLIICPAEGNATNLPPCGSSDHATVLSKINLALEYITMPPPNRKVYHWRRAHWSHIKGAIKRITIADGDVNVMTEDLTTKLQEITDRYVPNSVPKLVRKLPWWNKRCQEAFEKKQRSFTQNRDDYTEMNHAARRTYRRAFADYAAQLRQRLMNGTCSRSWWKATKHIAGLDCNKQRQTPDVEDLASYYETKMTESEDLRVPPTLSTDGATSSSFRITLSMVKRVLKKLDVNKSIGDDMISPRLLKECCEEVAPLLTKLFQKICRHASIPCSWKCSRTTSVYKQKGSRSAPASYRPVSVMPTLSTTFERVLAKQVKNKIIPFIPQEQFGFMPQCSTSDVGVVLADAAACALNDREELRMVALDIASAFDSIWWAGLLEHFKSIGYDGRALTLLKSYLTNRSMQVVSNGVRSRKIVVSKGVPQGGIWSPYFFLLYVRHLPATIRNCKVISFADDTTLYQRISPGCNLQAASAVNEDLDRLYDYGQLWKMDFSPTKSQTMVTSLKRSSSQPTPILMNGIEIPETSSMKILGFTFDSKANWSKHVDSVAQSSRMCMGAISRLSSYLRPKDIQVAYKAFVRSKIEYGNILYAAAASSNLQKLDRVQDAAIRLSSDEAPKLSSLNTRRKAAIIGLTCKLLGGNFRHPLTPLKPEFEERVENRRSQRLQPRGKFKMKLTRTSRSLRVFDRSYRGSMPEIWNQLMESSNIEEEPESWQKIGKELQKKICSDEML
jgi:hypothetical protein